MWSELFFEKFVIFVVRVATNVFGRIATIVIGVATILFFFATNVVDIATIAADYIDCGHIIRPLTTLEASLFQASVS